MDEGTFKTAIMTPLHLLEISFDPPHVFLQQLWDLKMKGALGNTIIQVV